MHRNFANRRHRFGAFVPLLAALLGLGVACGAQPQSGPAADAYEPKVDLVSGASPHWEIRAGKPGGMSIPSAMIAWKERIFVVHDDVISEYDAATDTWKKDEFRLPATVGTGVALTLDPAGRVFIFRGGKTRDFWCWHIEKRRLEVLTETPKKTLVGRAASLAYDADAKWVYALPGNFNRRFLRYDEQSKRWTELTKVGGKVRLAGIGRSTGGLQVSKGIVYAWPDHHVQRFDPKTETWLGKVHISYGVRPWWDGQMYAHDRDDDTWVVLPGMNSRTLTRFSPNKKGFAYLRPRLPVMLSGEGNRAVVVRTEGKKYLYVYAVAQGNRMLRIPYDKIEEITAESPQSDLGSEFLTFHGRGGSSLVRQPSPDAVRGVMKKIAPDTWCLARLKNIRFFSPSTNRWTRYPGVHLGARFKDGLCGAADGQGSMYFLTGSNTNFQRIDAAKLEAEKLPDAPEKVGLGADMVILDGRAWVLAGGESRRVFQFDLAKRTWSASTPLPEAATPVGEAGAVLFDLDGAPAAISGTALWRWDGKAWTRRLDLPFAPEINGGQAAYDAKSKKLFVVKGDGARDLAIINLGRNDTVETKILPDAVSVGGARALIDELFGKRFFVLHRGHDTHEVFLLEIDSE